MAEIYLQFDVADKQLTADLSRKIEDRLKESGVAEDVGATVQEPRLDAGTVVTTIAAVVLIVHRGDDLVEAVRKLVKSATALVKDLGGLREAFVELGGKRVPVAELSEPQIRAVAEQA